MNAIAELLKLSPRGEAVEQLLAQVLPLTLPDGVRFDAWADFDPDALTVRLAYRRESAQAVHIYSDDLEGEGDLPSALRVAVAWLLEMHQNGLTPPVQEGVRCVSITYRPLPVSAR